MKLAFGDVSINNKGQALLRRVANDFGGYKWNLARSRPIPAKIPSKRFCVRPWRKPAKRLKSTAGSWVHSSAD